MARFDRVDKILDFAISMETEAHRFYGNLAKRTKDSELRDVLKGLAQEELYHRGRLQAVKQGKEELFREKGVDLDVDDCSAQVEGSGPLRRKDIISLAIRREHESIKLYKDLAARLDWGGLRETFLLLAQEEAKHKLRFEAELQK